MFFILLHFQYFVFVCMYVCVSVSCFSIMTPKTHKFSQPQTKSKKALNDFLFCIHNPTSNNLDRKVKQATHTLSLSWQIVCFFLGLLCFFTFFHNLWERYSDGHTHRENRFSNRFTLRRHIARSFIRLYVSVFAQANTFFLSTMMGIATEESQEKGQRGEFVCTLCKI